MTTEEKEIRIKLAKPAFDKLETEVAKISPFSGEKWQKDEYFDNQNLFITNLNRGLRIRWNNNKPILLEFKSLFYNPYSPSKTNPWYIEEIKMPFPLKTTDVKTLNEILVRLGLNGSNDKTSEELDYEKTVALLEKNNLKPQIVVSKKRREYKYQEAEITFDEIEKLGYFVEIEAENPETVFHNFGINNIRVIRIGYNDLIGKDLPNFVSNDEKQRKFLENPRWNILKSEEKLVEKLLKKSNS